MGDPHITNAINQIGTLHEARFVMLDGCNGRKQLMFASSFDGPWDVYIDDFARTDIGRAFDETWCYVEGYPGVKSPRIKEWFKERTVVAGNFVAAVDHGTRARLVGEPSGGAPNQWGDRNPIELPVAGLTAYVAAEYVEVVRSDRRLAVEPDVRVEPTVADFLAGRDPDHACILPTTLVIRASA